MNNSDLFDAFDACLTELAAGKSVGESLRAYPALAADLRPMLEAAEVTMRLGRPSGNAQMRSRAGFLGAAGGLRQAPRPIGLFAGALGRFASTFIAIAVGFILGTTGLYYTSANTLPGDSLYGVKRAFEDARLQFASDPSTRYSLEESFNNRRSDELTAVLAQDRAVTVTFGGLLTARTDEYWQVGGFDLEITDRTRIIGDPQPGFYVSVVAENHNGNLEAIELRAEEVELIGVLVQRGNRWAINAVDFSIGPETVVNGTLAPGVPAAARIRTLQTGDRVALSVVTLAPTTSAPQPTATASPTPKPSATASPRPSRTAVPTVTRTATPVPTLVPTIAVAVPTQTFAAPAPTVDDGNANENGNGNVNENGNENGNSNDNSGSGNSNENSNDSGNSGPGGGGGDDGGDNSGPGGGGGDDDHSGPGGGGGGSGSGSGGSGSGGGGGGSSGSGDDLTWLTSAIAKHKPTRLAMR